MTMIESPPPQEKSARLRAILRTIWSIANFLMYVFMFGIFFAVFCYLAPEGSEILGLNLKVAAPHIGTIAGGLMAAAVGTMNLIDSKVPENPDPQVYTIEQITEAFKAPIIKEGDVGDNVEALQTILQESGCQLDVDRKFGPETKECLIRLQSNLGAPQTGVYDHSTMFFMDNFLTE